MDVEYPRGIFGFFDFLRDLIFAIRYCNIFICAVPRDPTHPKFTIYREPGDEDGASPAGRTAGADNHGRDAEKYAGGSNG